MDKSAWPLANWGLTDEKLEQIKEEIRLHPPMLITVSSGEITQIIPIYQDRAIEILRLIVNTDPYSECWCLFCRELCADETHKADCPYLLAKQLLEEIDNGRTTTEIT